MPIIGIKNEITTGNLQIIPVRGLPIQSTWNLIWHKNKNFSPIAKAYLAFLEEYKQDIIKSKFDWTNSI